MKKFTQIMSIMTTILFASAAAFYLYTNFIVYQYSSDIIQQVHDAENPKDPLRRSKLKIVNQRDESWGGFKSGYEEFARFSDIKADRFIRFTAHVPIKKLLKEGEASPSRTTENVFAKTRSIYYAREECNRVMDVLATQCEVARADGKIRDGLVEIQAALRFVQKEPFGDLDPKATWSFESITNPLTRSNLSSSLTSAERKRKDLYRKAKTECETIKTREGNCAITAITISANRPRNSPQLSLSARAEYAFLLRLEG